jgi:crossover junction endodeoxyribonuclease RuvC
MIISKSPQNIICGIDPGLDGGIAFSSGHAFLTPIIKEKKIITKKKTKIKKYLDTPKIVEILKEYNPSLVIMEAVGAWGGDGVCSAFTFGLGVGIFEGVCGALYIPMEKVDPKVWKEKILPGTLKDKQAAIDYCHINFPLINLQPGRTTTDQDGMADALCIMQYGIEVFGSNIK